MITRQRATPHVDSHTVQYSTIQDPGMPYSGCLRVPCQSLRIAVVQFAPKVRLMSCHVINIYTITPRALQIGHVQQNIERARRFCER